jgi:pseudaminic acid synthase
MKELIINNKTINENNPVFIIAELSANHCQKLDIAIKTIEAIAKAGADAVKFQMYTPDTLTLDCDNEYFKLHHNLWGDFKLYDLYKRAYMPWEWLPTLIKAAKENNLIWFSSVFDKTSVDYCEKYNIPAYKIASFEINDIPLLNYVAKKNKPVIFSTGIADEIDINNVLKICDKYNNKQVGILKCISSYPTTVNEMNLNNITYLREQYEHYIIGLSDHSLSDLASIISVTLGAKIIEKHFILNKKLSSPDASFSLCPSEFKNLVQNIRDTEKALGKEKMDFVNTHEMKKFSKSVFIIQDIKKDEIFTKENIKIIRPNDGMDPRYIEHVIGKQASVDLEKGTPLNYKYVKEF